MTKAIEVAKRISKDLDNDCSLILQEYNLMFPFQDIYELKLNDRMTNTLICAIIYSYDANSNWCDLKKTSFEDKINILKGLKADLTKALYYEFIELRNEEINNCIGEFLDLQTDWRFAQIMRSRDYHSRAIKEDEPQFTGVDDDKIIKAKEGLGKYLREGLNHRKLADEYILQLEKDYVNLNHRTELDFGQKYTEVAVKKDIMSWSAFIHERNERKKLLN